MKPRVPLDRLRRALNLGVSGSNTISPTAHYTGYVWAHHGLGPREFATGEGAIAYRALAPFMAAARRAGQPALPDVLVARHTAINELLRAAIADGSVSQIVEIAAGLSPRGCVFNDEFGSDLVYIEADLPPMAALKRAKLEPMGSLGEHHRVVDIDALANDGEHSIASVFSQLDPTRGTAVVTEGLLPYLSEDDIRGVWRRIATEGTRFSDLLYVSDLYIGDDTSGRLETLGWSALRLFVRSGVERHFTDADEAQAALREAGFRRAEVLRPEAVVPEERAAWTPGGRAIRVLSAG